MTKTVALVERPIPIPQSGEEDMVKVKKLHILITPKIPFSKNKFRKGNVAIIRNMIHSVPRINKPYSSKCSQFDERRDRSNWSSKFHLNKST